MEGSNLHIEIIVLLILAILCVITFGLAHQPAVQSWGERRLPWLFDKEMTLNWEAMACSRPFNSFAIMFFAVMGSCAVVNDFTENAIGPVPRYGAAILVAGFALYSNRRSAAQRVVAAGG